MNKSIILCNYLIIFLFAYFTTTVWGQELIVDHNCAKLNIISVEWIDSAKAKLHIAYQHTSHGSQLITGMEGLYQWKGEPYSFNNGGSNGALDLYDNAMSSYGAYDLGNPDRIAWATATYNFLIAPENVNVNVIIWSWCGQVSSADSNDIVTYLDLMTALEDSFPSVNFVYMTGHLDGTGVEGNLHQRNEQIRSYCRDNNKILYDFADIESYDPDGIGYLDKHANDNCDYDSDNNGTLDKNWAIDWQNSHIENVDWYNCSVAHSQPLNGNLKAFASWYLWTSLAGWNGGITEVTDHNSIFINFNSYQNFPNPFNPSTTIRYEIGEFGFVSLKVFDILGSEVATLVNDVQTAGIYEVNFDATGLPSGTYFYTLTADNFTSTKKLILLK